MEPAGRVPHWPRGDLHTGTAVESVAVGGSRRLQVHTAEGAADRRRRRGAGGRSGRATANRRRITELGDDDWRQRVADIWLAQPFMVQRLWLDSPVDPGRPPFLGTGGLEPVDNISVVSNYERQAAEWARDARRFGGRGALLLGRGGPGVGCCGRRTAEAMLARLHQLYPETARAGIVAERLLLKQDCPLFSPGSFARRPTVDTGVPGLMLAGDGIRNRPAGGPDGTCRDDRLVGGEPVAGRLGDQRAHPTRFRCRADRRYCGASPSGGALMGLWAWLDDNMPKDVPLQVIPKVRWADQAPTYQQAEPAIIDAALRRAERPSGNCAVFGGQHRCARRSAVRRHGRGGGDRRLA